MAKLPKGPPTLRDVLREQRIQVRRQGTASPFDGTGITVGADGSLTVPGTLTAGSVVGAGGASQSYVDAATAVYGLEAPSSALALTAATVTAVPWGAPSENTGGYVVSGGNITVPSGMGGVYAITTTLQVANAQPTRAYINLYAGASRLAAREVFTGDTICTASVTARVADLGIIKAEVYCATATSINGGWVTLYRLHS